MMTCSSLFLEPTGLLLNTDGSLCLAKPLVSPSKKCENTRLSEVNAFFLQFPNHVVLTKEASQNPSEDWSLLLEDRFLQVLALLGFLSVFQHYFCCRAPITCPADLYDLSRNHHTNYLLDLRSEFAEYLRH